MLQQEEDNVTNKYDRLSLHPLLLFVFNNIVQKTFLFHVLQVRAAFRERRILVPFEVVLMEKVWTVVTCVTVICWI